MFRTVLKVYFFIGLLVGVYTLYCFNEWLPSIGAKTKYNWVKPVSLIFNIIGWPLLLYVGIRELIDKKFRKDFTEYTINATLSSLEEDKTSEEEQDLL